MMRSLYTATTGMVAMQLQIDTMAHNLANVNTLGFKKSRAEFEDLMYQTLTVAGTQNDGGSRLPTGLQVGMGVRPTTVHKFFQQGDFQNTANQLDIAISGQGFFRLQDPAMGDAGKVAGFGRIRQNHRPAACVVTLGEGGRARADFEVAQRAIAPGQSLVLYDGEGHVLGGGIIERAIQDPGACP